jgi:hypothetical protein
MESKPQNSMISPTENSVSPPSRKRQKTLSDKDGDQCDDVSHQVVIYKNDKSDRGRDEQSASHLPIVPAKPSKKQKRAWESKLEPLLLNVLNFRNGDLFQQKKGRPGAVGEC